MVVCATKPFPDLFIFKIFSIINTGFFLYNSVEMRLLKRILFKR